MLGSAAETSGVAGAVAEVEAKASGLLGLLGGRLLTRRENRLSNPRCNQPAEVVLAAGAINDIKFESIYAATVSESVLTGHPSSWHVHIEADVKVRQVLLGDAPSAH